jgi:ESF2/ABP1 family protein
MDRGVIHLTHLPPHSKPTKLRRMLSQFGKVERILMCAEDDASLVRRRREGGSKERQYRGAYVEFSTKKEARDIATMLNGQKMSQHKGSVHYDDRWCLSYLKGQTWEDILEGRREESHVREQRVKHEVEAAKREADAYMEHVVQKKKLARLEERLSSHTPAPSSASSSGDDKKKSAGADSKKVTIGKERHYPQRVDITPQAVPRTVNTGLVLKMVGSKRARPDADVSGAAD